MSIFKSSILKANICIFTFQSPLTIRQIADKEMTSCGSFIFYLWSITENAFKSAYNFRNKHTLPSDPSMKLLKCAWNFSHTSEANHDHIIIKLINIVWNIDLQSLYQQFPNFLIKVKFCLAQNVSCVKFVCSRLAFLPERDAGRFDRSGTELPTICFCSEDFIGGKYIVAVVDHYL